jgi:hypothetical protein
MSKIMNTKGPFNGDTFLLDQFREIVKKHHIKTIIETGTHLAETAEVLADMADHLLTFETNTDWYRASVRDLKSKPNAKVYHMNSVEGLNKYLHEVTEPVLFFLDAHWEQYNPLLDELKEIAEAGLKPIIAIHDFKVPGHPELGYDSYNGQDYDWGWIRQSVEKIYGIGKFTIKYNSQATGAKRGCIFIYPA